MKSLEIRRFRRVRCFFHLATGPVLLAVQSRRGKAVEVKLKLGKLKAEMKRWLAWPGGCSPDGRSHSSGISKARQILRARRSGISLCRGHGLTATGLWVSADRMGCSLTLQRASVGFEVADQGPAPHDKARGTSFSPWPKFAMASSLRSCMSSKIDSRRDSSAASSVSAWPLASGNSGENATNHFPSRSSWAVNGEWVFMPTS